MLTNKLFFLSQATLLMVFSAAFVFPSFADSTMSTSTWKKGSDLESLPELDAPPELDERDANYGLEKTLEYNFSPVDRARLRRALTDYARNNDPEHIKIKKQRKRMRENLQDRFNQCNSDLDDSLDRQEVTDCLPQIARHFNAVDVDKDNVITFAELELAQAKWKERHRAAEAKLEAQRIREAEAEIKLKAAQPKETKQASAEQQPS